MMLDHYIACYRRDVELRASLDMLRHHVFWTSSIPVFRDDFFLIFARSASRALYHSANAWHKFSKDLLELDTFLQALPEELSRTEPGSFFGTSDEDSKFDVEAFLVAAESLFDFNLRGLANKNRLGKSFKDHPAVLTQLDQAFKLAHRSHTEATGQLRDHIAHVNPELRDIGIQASIAVEDDRRLTMKIPKMYVERNGIEIDLADIFFSVHPIIQNLTCQVRDTCLQHLFSTFGSPTNTYHSSRQTEFGVHMCSIGTNGLTSKWFDALLPAQDHPA